MKMNYVIVDQVIEHALNEGIVAIDEQDPAGKRFYDNKIKDYDLEEIML